MKQILTQDITNAVGLPVKSGTLEHLQEAYQEAIAAIARGLISNWQINAAYILFGCENSLQAPQYNISEGAVFFNGIVYLVDAVQFTTANGKTAVGKIAESFALSTSKDPVRFTDGSDYNVHSIKKMVIAEDFSASGSADYANWKNTLIKDFAALQTAFNNHTHNYNDILNRPAGAIVYKNNEVLGEIGDNSNPYDSVFDINIPQQPDLNYMVLGSLVSLNPDSGGSPGWNWDNDCSFVIADKTTVSFKIGVRFIVMGAMPPVRPNVSFDYVIIRTV